MAEKKEPRRSEAPELRTEVAAPTERRRRVRPPPERPAAEAVTDAVRDLSEGIGQLLRGHLQLARVEFKQEARGVARDLVMELGGTPLLLFGYLLLWVAGALALGLVMPLWATFLIAAGVNLLAGAGLLLWGTRRLKREKVKLPASTDELKKDRTWASELRSGAGAQREELH